MMAEMRRVSSLKSQAVGWVGGVRLRFTGYEAFVARQACVEAV